MYDKKIELRRQKSNGYLYFIDREHPLAIGNSGKVYYHRHVASIARGKWLNSKEHTHHLDGNKENNKTSNLVVVTATAHVHAHRGRRRKKKCAVCKKPFTIHKPKNKYCSQVCSSIGRRKVSRPPIAPLKAEIKSMGYEAVGRKYGVSGNAIRKWLNNIAG